MSYNASTDSYSQGAVDQAAKTVLVTLYGGWNLVGGEFYDGLFYSFWWSIDNGVNYIHGPHTATIYGFEDTSGGHSGTYNYVVGQSYAGGYVTDTQFACDKNCAFYSQVAFYGGTGEGKTKLGSVLSFKSYAIDMTASTPSSSALTASTATIACNFFPNTDVSTATVRLEYRIFGSGSAWTVAGVSTAYTGYLTQTISRNLTGLAGSTTYEYRLVATRDTSNSTTFTSSSNTFTTSAAAPATTTNAATSVASSSATLNSTVNPNTFSTDVTFQYGTAPGVYGSETSPATTVTGANGQGVAKGITGLTASTTYYFRAKGVYSGGTVFGAELSFLTAADPLIDAASEDHVYLSQWDGTYGVAFTVSFCLSSPAATSSDRLVTTAPGSLFAAGDIKVSKDAGAFANVANSVAQITAAMPTYTLQLSAAEMQAENIIIQIVDLNGPAFRDLFIHVRTTQRLGKQIVDATQYGSNNAAITLTGVGTSPALSAAGGATSSGDITGTLTNHVLRRFTATAGAAGTVTFDASASTTADYFKGAIVSIIGGTGAGQCRFITAYSTGRVATVHASWATNPDATSVCVVTPCDDPWNFPSPAELTAIPSSTSTMRQFLQAIFQRFFYLRTQTITTQTLFKADSSTSLGSASVSDNGTTQSSGKIS